MKLGTCFSFFIFSLLLLTYFFHLTPAHADSQQTTLTHNTISPIGTENKVLTNIATKTFVPIAIKNIGASNSLTQIQSIEPKNDAITFNLAGSTQCTSCTSNSTTSSPPITGTSGPPITVPSPLIEDRQFQVSIPKAYYPNITGVKVGNTFIQFTTVAQDVKGKTTIAFSIPYQAQSFDIIANQGTTFAHSTFGLYDIYYYWDPHTGVNTVDKNKKPILSFTVVPKDNADTNVTNAQYLLTLTNGSKHYNSISGEINPTQDGTDSVDVGFNESSPNTNGNYNVSFNLANLNGKSINDMADLGQVSVVPEYNNTQIVYVITIVMTIAVLISRANLFKFFKVN